jgi:16S rRNA G966 N2-methylase RsmD
MEKPIIDDEFRRLLPELAPEELAELEESVLEEGIRDPLILWQETGILLDGHNRLSIAQKHGLPYQTQELAFADREAARDWIINNQLGRRNLTPEAFALLLGMKYNREKQQGKRTDLTSGQNDQKSQAQQTSKRLAEEHKVNERTVRRAGNFAEDLAAVEEVAGKEVREAVLRREKPIKRSDVTRLANTAKKDPERVKQAVHKVLSGEEKDPKHALAVAREDEVKAKANAFTKTDLIDLRHGRFQDVLADEPDDSFDFIFTDPPYGKEYLSLWNDLGAEAARVLKPNGFLVTYVGKLHLLDCMNALAESLEYHWQCAVAYQGAKKTVFGRRFWGQWRPLLVYVNGIATEHRYCNDLMYLTKDHRPDQSLHPWAQADAAAAYFIDRLTEPGDRVLDPMCGTGAFVRAAAGMKREAVGIEADENRFEVCRGLSVEGDDA